MSDVDELKARVKKASARATTAKMNLHDLSEELPVDWEKIMDVAAATRDAYAELFAARAALKAAEDAA